MSADQVGIRCVFMRGGSSRGGVFLAPDLPEEPALRDRVLLAVYGSPDARQVDGIGGADPLTSKAAIIRRSERPDADVEYTFAQVGIAEARVSYGGNCGNMLAAVGPFAIDHGLVDPVEGLTRVRIYNTNTDKVIVAEVQTAGGRARVRGDCRIAGVPGTGARILLDFGDCAGSMSGRLLPTGRARDVCRAGGREMAVSFVDAATPFVFVPARDIGMNGTEAPPEILANPEWLARLEAIRGWAAAALGLVDDPALATAKTPNVPRVAVVSEPKGYPATTGEFVAGESVTLLGRQMAMQRPHQAYAVTGAICTAVAAAVPGSVVQECARPTEAGPVVIGHPSGRITVDARVEPAGGGLVVRRAALERTARTIMDGVVYIPRTIWER